jgi:hypothetical protein
MIRDFVTSVHESMVDFSKTAAKYKNRLSRDDTNAIRALRVALISSSDETSGQLKKDWDKNLRLTVQAEEIVLDIVKSLQHEQFLAEMALSYMISFQEGFIKDYLTEVFASRFKLLKSGRNLTYESVLEFTSIATLRRHMAGIETNNLGYGSIDDIGLYLEKKFNISLDQESFWPVVREASYRRNLIIHNRGYVNEVYRSKVRMPVKIPRLKTDADYVNSAADSIIRFMDFLHWRIRSKLRRKTGSHD